MDLVQQFISLNSHQLGYIMKEASRVWTERDPIGAFTVGECNAIVQKYGQYHELLEKIEELEAVLRFCKNKAKQLDTGSCYQATLIIEQISETLNEEYDE
mgnify:CR=1 FL=1